MNFNIKVMASRLRDVTHVGSYIKELREKKKMETNELAERLGIFHNKPQRIANYEKRKHMYIDTFTKILLAIDPDMEIKL